VDSSGLGDLCYPVRPFPLRGELVHPSRVLYLAQDKISYLKLRGPDPPAVIAAQPLLVTSGSHHCPGTDLLEEIDVISSCRALSLFVIRENSRRSILKLRGQDGLRSIHKGERSFACCSTWGGPD
jgi:hypothetical protein